MKKATFLCESVAQAEKMNLLQNSFIRLIELDPKNFGEDMTPFVSPTSEPGHIGAPKDLKLQIRGSVNK